MATEKETRLPFWKSGRKVGIIKWADLESSFFFAVQKIITIFAKARQIRNLRSSVY